jgi:hypothetical protein
MTELGMDRVGLFKLIKNLEHKEEKSRKSAYNNLLRSLTSLGFKDIYADVRKAGYKYKNKAGTQKAIINKIRVAVGKVPGTKN